MKGGLSVECRLEIFRNVRHKLHSPKSIPIAICMGTCAGVSSVGLTIISVGVDRHWFWFQCQGQMEKMGQCRMSEYPLHGPLLCNWRYLPIDY